MTVGELIIVNKKSLVLIYGGWQPWQLRMYAYYRCIWGNAYVDDFDNLINKKSLKFS